GVVVGESLKAFALAGGEAASLESGDAEALGGGCSHEQVNWGVLALSDRGEVPMQRDLSVVGLGDCARERLDLGQRGRAPHPRAPRTGGGLDAGADGSEDHPLPSWSNSGPTLMASALPSAASAQRVSCSATAGAFLARLEASRRRVRA